MTQEALLPSRCEVIILTALPVEFRAIVAYLQETQEIIHPQGTIYRVGSFTREAGPLRVAVAQIGMGGGSAAVETERAIHFFRPNLLLFVGIAGGLKDVRLGDVVAATKVYAYESGKAGCTFEPRPEVWRASYPLEQRARHEVSEGAWQTRLGSPLPDPAPRAHIGALAAGEKVLASTQSAVYAQLKATYEDALAVEMEGHGFLQAVHVNHDMHGLVIRGISDLIDGKATADAGGSQTVAARHAAAFAFQVLAKFTFPTAERTSSSPADLGVWNVPYARNPHFTGRDDLLDRLHQHLTPTRQSDSTPTRRVALTQPLAIKGLGGIGKTQIAVEYAYRSREQGHYRHTLWVSAASEETIITSFVAMARLLPAFAANNETDHQKLVEAVKRWLEQCEHPWLLVFDNVDNADDLPSMQQYLPQKGNGSVLLTTRAHAVGTLAASLEVENMGLMEGVQLLLQRAQRKDYASDEEINEATNVVIALDCFPLALDQAGAYIEETRCNFIDYLHMYQARRKELLARRGLQAANYPDSVATTWSLSFQKLEQASPAGAQLLHLCAFLAPDQIPEELIRDGAVYWPHALQQVAADLFTFNQMIEELLKFSLVQRLAETHTFSIHRLVQAVQMDAMESEMHRQWAERITQALDKVFPEHSEDIATWPQCFRYLDQVQACTSLIGQYMLPSALSKKATRSAFYLAAGLLGFGLKIVTTTPSNWVGWVLIVTGVFLIMYRGLRRTIPTAFGTLRTRPFPLIEAAHLLDRAGLYLSEQALYTVAEPLLKRALTIREQQLGTKHLTTATSLSNLAALYNYQGRYEKAEPLWRRAVVIWEQQLGPTHPWTAVGIGNLAMLYDSLGRYEEAERLSKRALAIKEQQLGPTHPSTVGSIGNLAMLYRSLGRYEEAESLLKRALAIREQQLGAEHPDTALSLHHLATLYEYQGRYAEAEPLLRRALATWEAQLGTEHPKVAAVLNNLAMLYHNLGRYEEAEPPLKQALAICEQQLGAEHPDTATSLNNLADLYRVQGRYAEAESLYQRALAIREQQLGDRHPDTATSLNNLANLYQKQGGYAEAEPLYQRALHIWEQQLGPGHLQVAYPLNNLASLYHDQGKYAEAEPLYRRALAIREQQLGDRHPDTATSLNNLANLYYGQGKYAEAEPLLKRAVAISGQQLGIEHPQTQQMMRNYLKLLSESHTDGDLEALLRSFAQGEPNDDRDH